MSKMVAARYVGAYAGILNQAGGPYFDGEGKPLKSLHLDKGATVKVREEEVLGYTLLKDMQHEEQPVFLGLGRVVLPEDQGKSDAELLAMGYQFHQKSALWELDVPDTPVVPEKTKKTTVVKEGVTE